MVNSVVARGSNDCFDNPRQLLDDLCVNPELPDQVELVMNEEHGRLEEQRHRQKGKLHERPA
jgi:hypothetical protein